MSKTINSVPAFITREQYVAMFEQYGFDPNYVLALTFANSGIYAEVFETDEDGKRRIDQKEQKAIVNNVYIPVLNPEES